MPSKSFEQQRKKIREIYNLDQENQDSVNEIYKIDFKVQDLLHLKKPVVIDVLNKYLIGFDDVGGGMAG